MADKTITDPMTEILKALPGYVDTIGKLTGNRKDSSQNVNTMDSSLQENFSPLAVDQIGQTFPGLLGEFQGGDYSKEAAIRDSMGGVQNLFQDFRQTALPGVFNAEAASGGYNSSTGQLLNNDLISKVIAQGRGLIAKNVNDYAGIRNAQAGNITNMIRTALEANKFSQTTGEKNMATIGDETWKGQLQNPLVQGGLGMAGLYSLLGGSSGVSNLLGQGSSALTSLLRSLGIGGNDLNMGDVPIGAGSGVDSGSDLASGDDFKNWDDEGFIPFGTSEGE